MTPVGEPHQRAYAFNLGMFKRPIARILNAHGYRISFGIPKPADQIFVWGGRPTTQRGQWIAKHTRASVTYIEDAFLRSLFPGRKGEAPFGLLIDRQAPYFICNRPSDLENLLNAAPVLGDAETLRCKDQIERIRHIRLSKYSAFDTSSEPLPDGAVIVVDQVKNDASIAGSGASAATFRNMLQTALSDHPDQTIYIRPHPETIQNLRAGHFDPKNLPDRVVWDPTPAAPSVTFETTPTIYTVNSQFGFEAILHGLRPKVFAQSFYSGWGLSDDFAPQHRRQNTLSRYQLFDIAMNQYPKWYDVYRDKPCDLDTIINQAEAELRAWKQDHQGWHAKNIRLWKRRHFQNFFGHFEPVVFQSPHKTSPTLHWGVPTSPPQFPTATVEDGFVRSKGLGANLIPPLSLVVDDLGIYFDPSNPSRLEHLIAARAHLTTAERYRIETIIKTLITSGVSKYNLGGQVLDLPQGRKILVPGQVEDDASIKRGAKDHKTNLELLREARAKNPDAVIIYKPHPDVEAGLRVGAIDNPLEFADIVATHTDPTQLLQHVDAVWTITSLIGFEALLRGKKVTCLGQPFYAGWGLTDDYHPHPRRTAKPDLASLAYATLIDYPRYHDPITNRPCPIEVVLDRIVTDTIPKPAIGYRYLAKLQGAFSSYSWIWRRHT